MSKPPNKWLWAWVIWLLAFGVLEYKAVRNKTENDTLSSVIWWAIGTTGQRKPINWLFRIGLGALFAWLIPHFFTASI